MSAFTYYVVMAAMCFLAALLPVLVVDAFGWSVWLMAPWVAASSWLCALHAARASYVLREMT